MMKPKNKRTLSTLGRRGFLTSLVQSVRLILMPTIVSGKAWKSRHTIWSAQNMRDAILNGNQPELGGRNALTSLECVSATYVSHFSASKVRLPLKERSHPLVK